MRAAVRDLTVVAWSRLTVKHHATAEVMVGLLVGIAFGYAVGNI